MTRELSSHQKTSKVSDALREQYDSKSKDPTEPPMLIAAILDAGSTVRRHQLLGPETATPRRWVNDARPDRSAHTERPSSTVLGSGLDMGRIP